jgi:glycosyltransferase involved in cell wall biosynthesis
VDQIVIADDGSRGPDADRVAALARLSDVIEVRRADMPRGPAAARNVGLAHACGEHLLFLDDDDLLHPRLVEDGLAALGDRPGADVVVFLYRRFSTAMRGGATLAAPSVRRVAHEAMHPLRFTRPDNAVPRAVLEHRPLSAFLRYSIPIHSCLMRRSAIGAARFPEALAQGEDTYFWISLAAAGRRFVRDSRIYAYVRRHRGNITRSRRRYRVEIQACYERLLSDGLLTAPDDAFLAHLKLLWFKALTCRPGGRRHLHHVLCAPHLLRQELVFWASNALSRRWATS